MQQDLLLNGILDRVSKGASFVDVFNDYLKLDLKNREIVENAFDKIKLAEESYWLADQVGGILIRVGKKHFMIDLVKAIGNLGFKLPDLSFLDGVFKKKEPISQSRDLRKL